MTTSTNQTNSKSTTLLNIALTSCSVLIFIFFFIGGYILMSHLMSDPHVKFIKDAVLVDYNDTEIGTAFDEFFLQPTWESFETDTNQTIVEFTGEYLDGMLFEPVLIQFTLDSENETFDITYFQQANREQTTKELVTLLESVY